MLYLNIISYHRDDTSFHQIYPLFFIFAGDLLSVRDLRDLRAWLVPRPRLVVLLGKNVFGNGLKCKFHF